MSERTRSALVWETLEFRLNREGPPEDNPFTSVAAKGSATLPDGSSLEFSGFCDSPDGSVFVFRYLPMQVGDHRLVLTLDWAGGSLEEERHVSARRSELPGILKTKGWGFEWSGTGEPFYWNSTTAYLMAGLKASARKQALDRLSDQGINRIRVSLCPSRQRDGGRWMEPQVQESETFTYRRSPWPLENPESIEDPKPVTSRFDLDYWRSFEKLIQEAAQRGILVQVIFFMDGPEPQNYPFDRGSQGEDAEESLYFEYALARLGAFANIEWCLTNEWCGFRSDEWVESRGEFAAARDPYGHLISVHGHGHFPFRASPWCTHALFQVWDEHGGGSWAHSEREKMREAGVIKPIVNDENGYEDHYPCPWGESRQGPSRDWESRVRLAWEIVLSGAWCTVGEKAGESGGWINGLGEGVSLLFKGLGRLKSFAESFDLAATEPATGRSSGPTFCRTDGAAIFALWAPYGGSFSIRLPNEGPWTLQSFHPWTGEWQTLCKGALLTLDPLSGPGWTSPALPWGEARAYLIRRS